MKERFTRLVPPYFVDKFKETDVRQVEQLPEAIRHALIHGTQEEFIQALSDIRTRERFQRKTFLGEAAMELLRDKRLYAQEEQ